MERVNLLWRDRASYVESLSSSNKALFCIPVSLQIRKLIRSQRNSNI